MPRPTIILLASLLFALPGPLAPAQNPGQDPIARVNALMGARRYREAETLLRPMVEKAATPELQHALGFAVSLAARFGQALADGSAAPALPAPSTRGDT